MVLAVEVFSVRYAPRTKKVYNLECVLCQECEEMKKQPSIGIDLQEISTVQLPANDTSTIIDSLLRK
jgi:hypothetical protein